MNCWYTMATLRSRTGTPVTSSPLTMTLPLVGVSSPAIRRIRLVLPAWVAPSSTVTAPLAGAMLCSYNQVWAPTRLVTRSRLSCKAVLLRLLLLVQGRGMRLHPAIDLLARFGCQVQAQLGAAPQHVIRAHGPLLLLQIAQLALVQARRHLRAQVGHRLRIAQDAVHPRAVGPRQAPPQLAAQPGIARMQRVDEALEIGIGRLGRADPARQ